MRKIIDAAIMTPEEKTEFVKMYDSDHPNTETKRRYHARQPKQANKVHKRDRHTHILHPY